MSSASILTAYESCERRGYWARHWEKHRLGAIEMVRRGVLAGLQVEGDGDIDFGTWAGDEVVTLASERGLDADRTNLHRSVMNHAGIADLITTAMRRPDDPPWEFLPVTHGWASSCMVDSAGTTLRRFLPVSTWNPERQDHEIRSWYVTGEQCVHRMPMDLVVANLGPMSGGRRHSPWAKALLHPQQSSLRFRKRSRGTIDGFKETWKPIFREDHDNINREKWLQAMIDDEVLIECLFVIKLAAPTDQEAIRITDLAKRKLDALSKTKKLPEKQLSTCDGPIAPCPFRLCCWYDEECEPSSGVFDAI